MNILIVTPMHPMQIAEIGNELYKNCKNAEIYSLQSMALLAEETLQKEYVPTMFVYAAETRKHPHLISANINDDKIHIVYGNLDKNTDIKFDHVIGYTSNYGNGTVDLFDPYIEQMAHCMDSVFLEKKLEPIKWYTKEDCTYIFPTIKHLIKFLQTLGVKANEL